MKHKIISLLSNYRFGEWLPLEPQNASCPSLYRSQGASPTEGSPQHTQHTLVTLSNSALGLPSP